MPAQGSGRVPPLQPSPGKKSRGAGIWATPSRRSPPTGGALLRRSVTACVFGVLICATRGLDRSKTECESNHIRPVDLRAGAGWARVRRAVAVRVPPRAGWVDVELEAAA